MSVKQENRYHKWQTEYYNRKADERRAWNLMERQNAEIQDVKAQNEALLERVKQLEAAYKKRGVYLEVERQRNKELHEEIKRYKQSRLDWFRAFVSQKKAHSKLSAIVRLALSPETYHEYRNSAEEIYPSLFGKVANNV